MEELLRWLPVSSPWIVFLGSFILGVTVAAVKLIGRIVYPNVIDFPWRENDTSTPAANDTSPPQASSGIRKDGSPAEEPDKMKTVVLAGSFNPIHKGHVSMLEYLATRYGRVIVAIGINPDKVYPVTPYQRAALIETVLDHELSSYLTKIQVQVIQGYIWRTVQRQGACVFFRGIRSWEKDGVEERKLQILNTWGPLLFGPLWWPMPTVFLQGDPQYAHISSTLIRDICRSRTGATSETPDQESMLEALVPSSVAKRVMQIYGGGKLKA